MPGPAKKGFFDYYNYGGIRLTPKSPPFGSSRMSTGHRGVYAEIGSKWVELLDWTTTERAKVSVDDFAVHATPTSPRGPVVRRCLKVMTKTRKELNPFSLKYERNRLAAKTAMIDRAIVATKKFKEPTDVI